MPNLTYGENITLDTTAIPVASLIALAQRGLNHELGNVVASKVVGDIRKTINPGSPADVTTEAIKAWRAANEAEVAKMTQGYQALAVKAIEAGALGVRAASGGGASVDPLTREMRAIAKREITDILAASGLKFPGKTKDGEATVTLKGVAHTGEALVARRLAGEHRDRIEKEANRTLTARKREAEKNAAGGLDSLV